MARLGAWASGLLAATVLTAGVPALAANFTIGLGGGIAPDYEGSDDYKPVPNWLFQVDDLYHPDTYVTVAGPVLRSNFVPDPHFRAGVSGLWVPERDDVENNRVDDLDSTDTALLLGPTVGWDFLAEPTRSLTTSIDLIYDVANNNGFLITPKVTYFDALPQSKFSYGAELSTTWASDDYMSEQFGINANNAAKSGLDQYSADESFKDVSVGVNGNYRFTDKWSASLALQYKRMVGDAEDSPIVDDAGDANQFIAAATINFKF
ncbi:MAG: MipA/OmpV family protein [Geminicoccaceae bacterium]